MDPLPKESANESRRLRPRERSDRLVEAAGVVLSAGTEPSQVTEDAETPETADHTKDPIRRTYWVHGCSPGFGRAETRPSSAARLSQVSSGLIRNGGRPETIPSLLATRADASGLKRLLHREDALKHRADVGSSLPRWADHLAVGVDGDPLGDGILLDHVDEALALDVLRRGSG